MGTTFTQSGKFRYRHKFFIIVAVAILLLIMDLAVDSSYLQWGAGLTFALSMPYFILSIMEVVDKLNQ